MTQSEFNELKTNMRDGDFIAVSVDPLAKDYDVAGNLIQAMGSKIAHIEFVYDAAQGITITADGAAGHVKFDRIDRYIEKKADAVTLYLLRLENLANDEVNKMKEWAKARADLKVFYDWNIIKQVAGKEILCSIPLIGFLFNKSVWTTPPFNKQLSKGTICSRECAFIARQIRPNFLKKFWLDYIIPQIFFDADELEVIDRAGGE